MWSTLAGGSLVAVILLSTLVPTEVQFDDLFDRLK